MDLRPVQLAGPRDARRELLDRPAEEPVPAGSQDLGQGADRASDQRRPARKRLDRDEPEWLGPGTGHEGDRTRSEERVPIGLFELPEQFGTRPRARQCGPHDGIEIVTLACRPRRLGRDPEPAARPASDLDRIEDPLFGVGATDEAQVVGARRARPDGGVTVRKREAVVDHRRPPGAGLRRRLSPADRHRMQGGLSEDRRRLRDVEAAVERGNDGAAETLRQLEAVPLEVAMHDVEVPGVADDRINGLVERGGRVARDRGMAARS